MPTQLPSGNWRPRIRDPRTGKQLNPATVTGGPLSYPDRDQAEAVEREALKVLRINARAGVTVAQWRQEWTTDPLWARPSDATNIHNRERTRRFSELHANTPIRAITDQHVTDWLRGGKNRATVPSLRAMFNDAASAAAGRLIERNPWTNLRLPQSKGRKHQQPPGQAATADLVATADRITPPSFAAYLHVAVYEGMRPGELDALRWDHVDFQAATILVDRQWNAHTRTFTPPKHGVVRTITLTDPARDRLLTLPRESEFCFTTLRGHHYTPSTRSHHWNRVRCTVGFDSTAMYLATRHYFAWYAWNVLSLAPEDIAQHLGHQDGGQLVRQLYGHFDQAGARRRVREAFAAAPAAPIPLTRKEAA